MLKEQTLELVKNMVHYIKKFVSFLYSFYEYKLLSSKNIFLKMKSNSRIFGQAVENWFAENINCFCNGKFLLSNINQKSYDCSCNKCNKKIQIKSQKNIFRPNKLGLLKILGAEYQTTLKSINRKEEWDLFF